MNTDTLKAEFDDITSSLKVAWEDPKVQEAWEDFKPYVGTSVWAVYLLNKARRARKRGEYTKALYYAVIWLGVTNNSNASYALRQAKKRSAGLRGLSYN